MKKLIKYLVLTACILSFSSALKAQDHIIGSEQTPQHKSVLSAYSFGNFSKQTNGRDLLPWASSVDSIHVNASSVNSGDSITMLLGDVRAFITKLAVEIDTGTSSTGYTAGTTDTIYVYNDVNGVATAICMIADTAFTGTSPDEQSSYVSSQCAQDSCNYYLKIPATKFSGGTHNYKFYYWFDYRIK